MSDAADRRADAPATTATPVTPEALAAAEAEVRPDLPPAAQRALAEAEARRRAAAPESLPPEIGGRDGPEPVRYGDYELKGRAVDF